MKHLRWIETQKISSYLCTIFPLQSALRLGGKPMLKKIYMIYLLNFCAGCSCALIHWLRDLQFLIVLCNSGINPCLYAWRLPWFKRPFYKFLHLKARSKISDITTTSVYAAGKRETIQIPKTLSSGDERISPF